VAERRRVVVIGGGFGGLWAARALAGGPADVLLIDRCNYHTFLPLLYQVGAAELEPEAIAYPIRSILRGLRGVRFMLADVRTVNLAARAIETEDQWVPYDLLIVAAGSVSHFFGVAGAEEHAFPLKTLPQAGTLRNQILCCFERAAHEPDAARRRELLTFAIVGGGPTGVEFAGALAELIRGPLVKDYPGLDVREARVVLLEALNALLPGFPDRLQAYAVSRLRRMGVDVRLGATVDQIGREAVRLRDGTPIPARTVVWTAGVRGDPLAKAWGLPTTRAGRVTVLPTLQLPDHPEVYVVGDLAHVEQDGRPLPMIAPVAIQEGETAGRNVARQLRGDAPVAFRYRDRGAMVVIGRNAAVAYLRGRGFTGFLAWSLWLGVHLINLIGFRNRLVVLINWAWDYFFYERAVRLILEPEEGRRRLDATAAGKGGTTA
jgi:NADH dehydrogenase